MAKDQKDQAVGDISYPIHLDEPVQPNPAPPIVPDPPPTPLAPTEPPTNWASPHENDPRYQAGGSWAAAPLEHEGPTPNMGGVPTV